ncbi:hypothetical protein D3Z62_26655 [Lachnospiraceae bacterium]|nr:hypothetical protein [Lachnospiraceae bacterium]
MHNYDTTAKNEFFVKYMGECINIMDFLFIFWAFCINIYTICVCSYLKQENGICEKCTWTSGDERRR